MLVLKARIEEYNVGTMVRATHFADMAPQGAVWWCPQFGRISADRHGKLSMLGWSDNCSLLAVLVSESSLKLDPNGRVIEADLTPDQPDRLPGAELAASLHL